MGLRERALIRGRGWVFNFKRGQVKFYPCRKGAGKVLATHKGRGGGGPTGFEVVLTLAPEVVLRGMCVSYL